MPGQDSSGRKDRYTWMVKLEMGTCYKRASRCLVHLLKVFLFPRTPLSLKSHHQVWSQGKSWFFRGNCRPYPRKNYSLLHIYPESTMGELLVQCLCHTDLDYMMHVWISLPCWVARLQQAKVFVSCIFITFRRPKTVPVIYHVVKKYLLSKLKAVIENHI